MYTTTEDAWECLRLFTEEWFADDRLPLRIAIPGRYGGPLLTLPMLQQVVKSWEDTHVCAVAVYTSAEWDVKVLKTFASEEKARGFLEASGETGAFLAYWDDNGAKSCWREKRDRPRAQRRAK